ncbi:MAG TPA: phosphate signaling complex protein PhoU [Anaerolineae bacterium]|nr:phosphate signaling complex protein PhoU [Anaerolineae bacterium]
MTRRTFDQELDRLQDEVLALGSLVEEALIRSVETLKQRDFAGSRRLIAGDRAINERRYAIEEDTIALIATQQPMARDMRLLAAILEIVTELERMGDYAKGIARINLMIGEQPLIKPLIDLPVMALKARDMLHAALVAFVERDVQAARSIPKGDDEVDALYNQVYRELISYILEDPHVIEQANQLMWAAHNLERSADRVINLCERVIYTVTGELAEISAEDSGIESIG